MATMFTPYLTSGLLLLLVSQVAGQDVPVVRDPQLQLNDLVQRYMLLDDKAGRADIAKQIKQDQAYTPQRLDSAIRHVQLWQPLPLRDGKFVWTDRRGDQQATSYRLPVDYDPTQPYPLILGELPDWFGDSDSFVVVSLPSDLPQAYHESPDAHADLMPMLLEIRHRIHIDSQRTYLCAPANVGWLVLLTYPDIFAGAILHGLPLQWPYAGQLYPIMLENLRHVPIHWVLPSDQDKTASLLASYVQDQAKKKSIPLEFVSATGDQAALKLKSAKWLASLTQPEAPAPTSHWFRFPSQGRTPWLSADKYKGSPWLAAQLSIVVNPTVDRDVYITGVLKEKLAYLGGQVLGQSIEIETRRCERISWRLHENSIDWSKPITVTCNGQRRFEGPIKPSMMTMLESAQASWDFSRPVWSARNITIRSDAPD